MEELRYLSAMGDKEMPDPSNENVNILYFNSQSDCSATLSGVINYEPICQKFNVA